MKVLIFRSAGEFFADCVKKAKKEFESQDIDILLSAESSQGISFDENIVNDIYRMPLGNAFRKEHITGTGLEKQLQNSYEIVIIPKYPNSENSYFEVEKLARHLNSENIFFYNPERGFYQQSKISYWLRIFRGITRDLFGSHESEKNEITSLFAGEYNVKLRIDNRISKKRLDEKKFEEGARETETIKYILNNLKKGNVFFDVGAHLGLYSAFVAANIPEAKVCSFEPIAYLSKMIEENLNLNNAREYKIVTAAVGKNSGEVEECFPRDGGTLSMSQTRRIGEESKSSGQKVVVSISLDDFVRKTNLKPDVIKIDVEGAEGRVISGMSNILKNNRPLVLFEYHPEGIKSFPDTFEDIFEYFYEVDYWLFRLVECNEFTEDNVIENYQPAHEYLAASPKEGIT